MKNSLFAYVGSFKYDYHKMINDKILKFFKRYKDFIKYHSHIIYFATSSFVSFILDYLLYILFVLVFYSIKLSFALVLANILARILSASFNFFINHRFVFKHKHITKQAVMSYTILAATILAINSCLLTLIANFNFTNVYLLKIIVEITMFFVSWFIQKYYIFNQ